MAPLLMPTEDELRRERNELRGEFVETDLRSRGERFDLRPDEARALRRLDEIAYLLGE